MAIKRKDTETGRSDIISELEEALLDTDLDQYAVDSIVASLKKRRRRRAIIRGIVLFVALFAVSTAFFLVFRTGETGKPDVIVQAASTTSTTATTTATTSTTGTTATTTTTTTTTSAVKRPLASEKVKSRRTSPPPAPPETRKYAFYAVKVAGLDGTKSDAERIHAKLHQAGYSSELKTDLPPGGKTVKYHVRIGHFKNQADAEAFRKLLWKNEGIKGTVAGRE